MLFRAVPFDNVDWSALDRYDDRTCWQRKPWLNYLVSIRAGTPVVAILEDGNKEVGAFIGLRKRFFGVYVLGAPLPGWNTTYLGLNLSPGVPRTEALRALSRFAFNNQRCAYVEVSDPCSDVDAAKRAGYGTGIDPGFVSDLYQSEKELFGRMASACRGAIRKADKVGVLVEEAKPDGFAKEFYYQLENVYAHQGLKPTIREDRVEKLIDNVWDSGTLLLLRARTAHGDSIATAIFPGFGLYSGFWGNGSIRKMLHLRPNQAILWYAMRYWKARGVRWHHWGGGGDYKKAYGPDPLIYLRQYKSIVPGITKIRQPAIRAFYAIRDALSKQR